LLIALTARYEAKAGMGTLIAMLLPYSVALIICSAAVLLL